MKKNYLLIFLLLFSYFSSQTSSDIEMKIKNAPILISEGKNDEFIKVMDETIESSTKIGYAYGVANGYYGKAYVAYLERDLNNSINFAKLAEQENIGIEHSKLKTDIFHLLGQNYVNLGFEDDALKYYKKMIISSTTIPDKKKSIYSENIAYNDIASIYFVHKNKKDSAYYYMMKVYRNLQHYSDKDDKLKILLAKATTVLELYNPKGKKVTL